MQISVFIISFACRSSALSLGACLCPNIPSLWGYSHIGLVSRMKPIVLPTQVPCVHLHLHLQSFSAASSPLCTGVSRISSPCTLSWQFQGLNTSSRKFTFKYSSFTLFFYPVPQAYVSKHQLVGISNSVYPKWTNYLPYSSASPLLLRVPPPWLENCGNSLTPLL